MQALRNGVEPPLTWETLDSYVDSVFLPINQGENVTTVWVRMCGRRVINKFLIDNKNLFPIQIGKGREYLLVYIEPLDLTERSLLGYLRLLGRSIVDRLRAEGLEKLTSVLADEEVFQRDNTNYSNLLDSLKSLLRKIIANGIDPVLFLGEFDELEFADPSFYNNLKSIWSSMQPHLHYVFLVMSNVETDSVYEKYRDLVEIIGQNVTYMPILGEEDSRYLISKLFDKYGIKKGIGLDPLLMELCGGHPYLLKICAKFLAKNGTQSEKPEQIRQKLKEYYEAGTVCRAIFESLGPNSKFAINNILLGSKVSDTNNLAFRLGIVKSVSKDKYLFFGELFKEAIQGEVKSQKNGNVDRVLKKMVWNGDSGVITLDGEPMADIFTRQEHELLTKFLGEPNKLISRDEIGSVLWGKNSDEKYSDWAIDQVVSKLRKKLIKLGLGENSIFTVRGRGYRINL